MVVSAFPVPFESPDPGQTYIEWQSSGAGAPFAQWQTCLAGMPIADFKVLWYSGLAMQGLLASAVGGAERPINDVVQRAFDVGHAMAAH
jgi:hypothetical protein